MDADNTVSGELLCVEELYVDALCFLRSALALSDTFAGCRACMHADLSSSRDLVGVGTAGLE